MRIIFLCWSLIWLLLAPAAACAGGTPGTVAIAADGITYYAKAGDTLSSIAREQTTRIGNWVALGQLNHISRDTNIPIGTGILIPATMLADQQNQGRISAFSGQIRLQTANGSALPVTLGTIVLEGMQLETGANSFLTLTLADRSRVSIPSNSRITLSKLRMARHTKSPRTEITLQRGRVESQVMPLRPNAGRFEVVSPLSVTGVRGTHFRVTLLDNRISNEVLDGTVASGRPAEPNVVILQSGQGNLVDANGVGRAIALLPPPHNVREAPAVAADALEFELQPMATASVYQVQIATDIDAANIIAEVRSDTPKLRIKRSERLRAGEYFARVSVFDRNGLEGLTQTSKFMLDPVMANVAADAAAVPAGMIRTSGTHASVVSWTPVAAAQSYQLHIARDAGFRSMVLDTELTATRYSAATLGPGHYFWRVAALVMQDGKRVPQPFSATQSLVVLPAPEAPTVAGTEDGKLALHWRAEPGQRYLVQIARDPAFSWLLLADTTTASELRTNRPPFGTYYARVQLLDADGNGGRFSPIQAFVVTDQWVIHTGLPLGAKGKPLSSAR